MAAAELALSSSCSCYSMLSEGFANPMQKSYTLTPDQFTRMQAQLAAHGIQQQNEQKNADGSQSGQITDMGVTIGYVWDGVSALNLTILKKSFLPTASQVWDALDEYANG